MNLEVKKLASMVLGCLLVAVSLGTYGANQIVSSWRADAIASSPSETIRLLNKEKQMVTTLSKSRIVRLVDTQSRIQKSAGLSTEFFVVQFQDNRPNAFASSKDGRNIVGITPAMLELLGDDFDAYAAIFGHELAHIVKQHGADRAARTGVLQGLGLILGIVIGARTGVNPGGLIDLGTDIINKTFTRDEEREADKLGIDYMVSAGFDPQGAIRLHQRLMTAARTAQIPFLSTHPSSEERIANVREMIASLPPSTQVKAAPRILDKKDVAELVRRSDWPALLTLATEQTASNPADGSWWFYRGFAQQKLGNHQEAISAYVTALERPPKDGGAANNLGVSYLQLNQNEKAVEAFEEAIRMKPDYKNAWFGIGIAYHRLGEPGKVWDAHQELTKLDPAMAEKFAKQFSVPVERPTAKSLGSADAIVTSPDAQPEQTTANSDQAREFSSTCQSGQEEVSYYCEGRGQLVFPDACDQARARLAVCR